MKKYISPGSWFSFEYPDAWHEFEDEAGSFLFYNPSSWTGNFRISAVMDNSPDFARNVLRDELAQYSDAELVTIGHREFVYSRETFQEGGAWYTSHFWVTGYKQMAIYVTFTCAKGDPMDEVRSVLKSLYLMNPLNPQCQEVIPVRLAEVVLINEAYEQVQKEVKKELKKDFSSVDTTTGLANLQRLLDDGKMKKNPATIERLGRVLGCFLTDEMDGVEWVSVIDGRAEYPALLFHEGKSSLPATISALGTSLANPVNVLSAHVAKTGTCDLKQVYEELIQSHS